MEIEPVPYTPEVDEVILPPDVDDWQFDGGRFCFRGRWFLLRAERMRLLKVLAQAGRAMRAEEFGETIDLCPEGKNPVLLHSRSVAGVSRLRSALRKLFGIPVSWDPIQCVDRGCRSLSLPINFIPPRLDSLPPVPEPVVAVSPETLRASRMNA